MEHELQKSDQERGEKALETEEKVLNTLPELATVSEIVKGDKDVKREVGVVLNDENDEDINTMIDNDNNIKKSEPEKEEYSSNLDSKKINIEGSVEKQGFKLDDSGQVEATSNTELSLTGSKEKISEDITIDNVLINKTIEKSNVDDEIVEIIQVDKTVIDTPFEKTTFESINKTENNNNKPTFKSLKTDKITVQNLETDGITSVETVTTKKEVTEVSPDQTLTETITIKGNKDKVSNEVNVQSVEVKETTENDVKGQKNIESTTKEETITETPVDKTTVTLIVNDNSTINKVTPDDLVNEDLVIAHEDSGDKSKIDVIAAMEIREEKPQLEDNDDEDLETLTPATPENDEDLMITISKIAPELVSVIRDLKQASDKLDPIKRSWNDLKLRKSLEYSITNETDHDIKSDEDKLVQKAIDSIKEAMIEGVESENQEVDQERKVILSDSQIQTLIQPTSPSSIVSDVMESMVTPGFNNNVVLAMNICFWLLFTALIFLAVLSNYDYMVLLNLGISVLLYISLCWFIVVTRASQAEEAAKIAKKED